MDVEIRFLGAAKSVTGSKYLLRVDGEAYMVDCGLFQGPSNMRRRNWEDVVEHPDKIKEVFLTHAHIDHSGYLPRLVKKGFKGKIYCTKATAALLKIMLLDAGKLQEEEAKWAYKKGYSTHKNPEPLFTTKDAEKCLELVHTCEYDETVSVNDRIQLIFRNAGHILGSAMIEMTLIGDNMSKEILFSGDLGKHKQHMHEAPFTKESTDVLLVESTYGDRNTPDIDPISAFGEIINEAVADGCLIIPSFAVGRTQQILYYLYQLHKNRQIPENIRVFVDSPMAINVTALYKNFNSDHKLEIEDKNHSVFDAAFIRYINAQEDSINLNLIRKNTIIISASGMVTGGRILHHMYHRLPNKKDTILFVGYQAEGTKGREILSGENDVSIFGINVPIKAKIRELDGLSAHADMKDLHQWLGNFKEKPKRTFIVHGEVMAAQALQNHLVAEEWSNVIIPDFLESFKLFQSI